MKKVFIILIAIISSGILHANTNSNWMRYASISPSGEQIVFSYKGDLYLIPSEGGEAKVLTFHQSHDFMPVWSHDGTIISFASNRYGNFDVFVMSALGGEATRLTYHSNNEYPYSFTRDDKDIVFGGQRMDAAKSRQFNTGSQPEVYQVAVKGGHVNQLWTIPGEDIQISKSGNQMIYHDKPGGENAFRKHHTSSVTRDIWKFDVATNHHKMISSFNGEDRNPVYSPDEKSIFYLSEESGTFNVHKLSLENPEQTKQITKFDFHPVRYLSISDEGILCFTYHGDLYTQTENGEATKLAVNIRTEGKTNNQLIIPISGNVSEMAVSPNGKEVAYIVRGEVFVSSAEGKLTKRITNTPAQERFVSFSPDGKSLIYASERNALWSIYQTKKVNSKEPYFYAATLLNEETLIHNENDNYQPKYSPNGEEIAFIENKTFLKIFNLASKQIRTLLTKDELYYMRDGGQYFEWSPDSKWLFAEYTPVLANVEVVLLAADGKQKMINLTESGYGDQSPKWVNGGKQLLWFSDRQGLRSQANSGGRQKDVYSMFLTQNAWDKFNMTKDEYALWEEINKKPEKVKADTDKKKNKNKNVVKPKKDSTIVKIDWDNLRERKIRLTIHSSSLSDAVLSKDAETLYYLATFEKGINLWSTNLRTKVTKMLLKIGGRSGELTWDKEMKNLFLLANGKISKIDLKLKKASPIAIKGELELDVSAERQHMFDHVWKRNKTMFYISDYHGAPWDKLRTEYEPKLASISNDFEFAELLSEMLGELNVSHSGARYSSRDPLGDQTAALGIFIDYNFKGDGIKITEIINGGPLDKKHLKVSKGMIIKQIDGVNITADIDFAKLLNRKANAFTSLYIFNPSTSSNQYVTVKPITLRQEGSLLYKRWVKANADEVDRVSGGKLAYVHIPGMGDGPYRDTYEKVMGKYHDREALIIDTRNNGGGDLVSDLAMFLTGKKFLDYTIESRSMGYEPGWRWTNPSLAMVNESNYSDGHCFACGYQDLGIGKLVGMPVPGTCSWAGWESLQNRTVRWGSIPLSTKNSKGEWLENNQTIPEIMVKNMPGFVDNGRDQQLEAAIKELMNTGK
ncbi:MAG: peptidase S41 [Bacteroidetes bacterium]|nr:peptidase S41 [Bacteroidota bacterium]